MGAIRGTEAPLVRLTVHVRVPQMRTGMCAGRVRRSLHAQGPQVFAEFDLHCRCVTVKGADSEDQVLEAIQSAGYRGCIVDRIA
jgi:copper chaperone